jgi:hypothetical protein
VTATVDEDAARSTMRDSLPCKGSHSQSTAVSGADEACLDHKAGDERRGQAAMVSARYRTLVVEVSYQRSGWPSWRVDEQSAETAAALFGRAVRQE